MSKFLDEIFEIWNDGGSSLTIADGFDDCILGVALRYGSEPFIVYDMDKVIGKLVDDGMSLEEAEEYFEFNILGAYVGPSTPGYIQTYGR